jgi:exonuclease III
VASTTLDEDRFISCNLACIHTIFEHYISVTAEIDCVQQSFVAMPAQPLLYSSYISHGNNKQQAGVGAIRSKEEAAVTAAYTV